MSYEQAYKDHRYLWQKYGAADDMTGGYVDSDDLDRMLKNPTKKQAKECLVSQICYWFQVGPDPGLPGTPPKVPEILASDERVKEIAERYGCL